MDIICFHLSTCSTNNRIIDNAGIRGNPAIQFIDIKSDGISGRDLDKMKKLAGSYEALFSRRAMKFRSWGLGNKTLTESDYRDLILKEYTFLKRPVFIIGQDIFIGSSPRTVESIQNALTKTLC